MRSLVGVTVGCVGLFVGAILGLNDAFYDAIFGLLDGVNVGLNVGALDWYCWMLYVVLKVLILMLLLHDSISD